MCNFSIAVDPPSLKLWRGKEDGDGKVLSPAFQAQQGTRGLISCIMTRDAIQGLNGRRLESFCFSAPARHREPARLGEAGGSQRKAKQKLWVLSLSAVKILLPLKGGVPNCYVRASRDRCAPDTLLWVSQYF
jgi:hypothetical protein